MPLCDSTAQKQILVIDDEDSIRFTFSYLLAEQGHKVDAAASPDEAMACLNRTHYDLIFLDLLLGTHSGITTLEEIRKFSPGTPVVMITGAPDSDSVSRAVSLGAYAYLPKPIRLDTLIAMTNKALKSSAGKSVHPP
jgi:two-component system, NtrC family, response regulator HydG